MRILVIAGTGFIGSRVVDQLAQAGHSVAVFHRGHTRTATQPAVTHFLGSRQALASSMYEFRGFAPDVVLDMGLFTRPEASDLVRIFRGLTGRTVAISSMDVYQAYGCFRRREEGLPEPEPLAEAAPLRRTLYRCRSSRQVAR